MSIFINIFAVLAFQKMKTENCVLRRLKATALGLNSNMLQLVGQTEIFRSAVRTISAHNQEKKKASGCSGCRIFMAVL